MTPAEVLPGGLTRGRHEVQNLEQAAQNSDQVLFRRTSGQTARPPVVLWEGE